MGTIALRAMTERPSSFRFAVLGSGRIGHAIAFDLLASGAEHVVLADAEASRVTAVARLLDDARVEPVTANMTDASALHPVFASVSTVISAVPYRLNAPLAHAALRAGAHWIDLGGNTDVVEEILAMGDAARSRGVALIPDAGLQPGLGNILAGEVYRRLGGADVLRISVGGLPQHPMGDLQYQLVFSVEGLLNEYQGVVRTLERGRLRLREPLTDVEPFPWPQLPPLECFHTAGSASTLPATFRDRVDRLEVKTVRYSGHAATLQSLFGTDAPENRAATLQSLLPDTGDDLVIMRVEGTFRGYKLTFEIEDRLDPTTGLSAMMRTTGFTASAVAQQAARGKLGPGAIIQERDVLMGPVVDHLEARGIAFREVART